MIRTFIVALLATIVGGIIVVIFGEYYGDVSRKNEQVEIVENYTVLDERAIDFLISDKTKKESLQKGINLGGNLHVAVYHIENIDNMYIDDIIIIGENRNVYVVADKENFKIFDSSFSYETSLYPEQKIEVIVFSDVYYNLSRVIEKNPKIKVLVDNTEVDIFSEDIRFLDPVRHIKDFYNKFHILIVMYIVITSFVTYFLIALVTFYFWTQRELSRTAKYTSDDELINHMKVRKYIRTNDRNRYRKIIRKYKQSF